VQVVAGLILVVILYFCRSLLPPIGKWLLGILLGIWTFLLAYHPIQGWLLLVLISCSFVLAFREMRSFRRARKLGKSPKPLTPRQLTENDYVKDGFFDLIWRWKYGTAGIYDLAPFCSQCDMQVRCTLEYVDTWQTRTGYHCDNCGNHISLEGKHQYIEDNVTRLIQRKLRSGEWKKVVGEAAV